MPVVIVVGIQWGDEGKGKVVDSITENANYVVRFQGGNNAGHTVIVGNQKAALRLLPSGILRSDTRCLLASGVVVNPEVLTEEISNLKELGIDVTSERLGISGGVNLILPYHQIIDQEREKNRADSKIGTTGKGIGPAYEDFVSRFGIRLNDLSEENYLKTIVERNVEIKNDYLKHVLKSDKSFSQQEILDYVGKYSEFLKSFSTNVSVELNTAIDKDSHIVFEGAQGCLLDVTHGTYPYVTSSNTVSSYACVSAGVGPQKIDRVLGICKAYCTRVGSGPFITEDNGEAAEILRDIGKEFGTVTGRPRRCGWLDIVAAKRAIRLNGVDSIILTKLDVLSTFDKIKLGVSYTLDGKEIYDMPVSFQEHEHVQVEYEELDGWNSDITQAKTYAELPENARKYVERVEQLTNTEIAAVSVGPERSQIIIRNESVFK